MIMTLKAFLISVLFLCLQNSFAQQMDTLTLKVTHYNRLTGILRYDVTNNIEKPIKTDRLKIGYGSHWTHTYCIQYIDDKEKRLSFSDITGTFYKYKRKYGSDVFHPLIIGPHRTRHLYLYLKLSRSSATPGHCKILVGIYCNDSRYLDKKHNDAIPYYGNLHSNFIETLVK